MTSSTEPKLLIDITNARQATALNVESILHRMQIEAFLTRVDDVVGRVEGFKEKLAKNSREHCVSYERYHDVITLHGKRGSGKTTFLLSALKLLQEPDERKKNFKDIDEEGKENKKWQHLDNLCVLEILDPTLFGLHEHLLLSLLAKIAYVVRSAVQLGSISSCDYQRAHCKLEKWENCLRQFAKALKHMGETRDDLDGNMSKETVQWDDAEFIFEQNMESAKRSFGLEREFHSFLNDSLTLIGKKAFVLALDDIDTRPQIGWHVLEVLRRYFTSPQLVVVLSGDMELFKTIIEKQQLKIFDLNFASDAEVRKEFKSRVDGLTEQYLLKILRTPSRINLGSFQSALDQWDRSYSKAQKCVGSVSCDYLIDELLDNTLFKLLGCSNPDEQRIFKQALFSNPARTVTQILDALWDGYTRYVLTDPTDDSKQSLAYELLVSRFREVFLVSLQNLGFERPFDFAEMLKTTYGLNLLMEKLFVRGGIRTGMDLRPTSASAENNNALMALNVEVTRSMRDAPVVLMSYIFKVCLLREVLSGNDIYLTSSTFENYSQYLCFDTIEKHSVIAKRISALLLGSQVSNLSHPLGLVRVYGKSITKKAPTAVLTMYGKALDEKSTHSDVAEPELLEFCKISTGDTKLKGTSLRRWINTPETLSSAISSWQKDIVSLGLLEMRVGDGDFRAISIFSLLAVMVDLIDLNGTDFAHVFSQGGKAFKVNPFAMSGGVRGTNFDDDDEDDEKDDVTCDPCETPFFSAEFVNALKDWVVKSKILLKKVKLPTMLSSLLMERYFSALVRFNESRNRSRFVGEYIHRCLVMFFNCVLVEEAQLQQDLQNKIPLLVNAPTGTDEIFLKNYERYNSLLKEGFSSEEYFPLFTTVFSCPLWGLFIKPNDSSAKSGDSVFARYMSLPHMAGFKDVLVLPGFPWVTPVRNWPGRGLDRHRRSRWLS